MRVGIRHSLRAVHRIPYTGWPTVEDMFVNHGPLDILLPSIVSLDIFSFHYKLNKPRKGLELENIA